MPTVALTHDSFSATTTAPGIVVVDCWAEWCAPCRGFRPIFDAAAERHPDIVFATVDIEAEAGLAAELAIQSVPTLIIYRDSAPVFRHPGGMDAATLDELIASVAA
jgi:thioredoxin 1